jgi:GTP cyclohydrolase I
MDEQRVRAAVRELLEAIGDDAGREGLRDTPDRVARMYTELFSGLSEDPAVHLKVFEESGDEMVIVRDIPFYSMCEHHLLPFFGKAHIAYLPANRRVLGLSKLARIVNCYARRPQLQERLTCQIADFLYRRLPCAGVAVVLEAEHLCMTMRGVKASGAQARTSALRGAMREASVRAEALRLLKGD